MKKYHQVNSYTWVVASSGKTKIPEEISASAPKAEKPPNHKKKKDDLQFYKNFCRDVFSEQQKFICIKIFNKTVKEKIHSNFTYYRKRMEKLELISIKKNIVKPGRKLSL